MGMASVNERVSIEDMSWSKSQYSLAEFVENFQLPQVVCVETGYYIGDEETNLSSGQVVQLHSVQKRKQIVCKTVFDKTVKIPYACPLKCVVENGEFTKISAQQLGVLSENVRYIMALTGYYNSKLPSNSFQEGTIFEVIGVDATTQCIQCRNTSTGKRIRIDFDCAALFCWLRDCNRYTLAEVAVKFKAPVKVRLLRKLSAINTNPNVPRFVLKLKQVNVVDIAEETVVVLSVLGENSDDVCVEMAKDVPVSVFPRELKENEIAYGLDGLSGLGLRDLDIYQDMAEVVTRANDVANELENAGILNCVEIESGRQQTLPNISKAESALSHRLESVQPTQGQPTNSDRETSSESVHEEPRYVKVVDLMPGKCVSHKWTRDINSNVVNNKHINRKPPQVKPKPLSRSKKNLLSKIERKLISGEEGKTAPRLSKKQQLTKVLPDILTKPHALRLSKSKKVNSALTQGSTHTTKNKLSE